MYRKLKKNLYALSFFPFLFYEIKKTSSVLSYTLDKNMFWEGPTFGFRKFYQHKVFISVAAISLHSSVSESSEIKSEIVKSL